MGRGVKTLLQVTDCWQRQPPLLDDSRLFSTRKTSHITSEMSLLIAFDSVTYVLPFYWMSWLWLIDGTKIAITFCILPSPCTCMFFQHIGWYFVTGQNGFVMLNTDSVLERIMKNQCRKRAIVWGCVCEFNSQETKKKKKKKLCDYLKQEARWTQIKENTIEVRSGAD